MDHENPGQYEDRLEVNMLLQAEYQVFHRNA